MNRSKVIICSLFLCAIFALWAAPADAGIRDGIPMMGTFPGGTFSGVFDLDRFALDQRGNLIAVGVLKGTLTRTASAGTVGIAQAAPAQVGPVLGSIVQLISVPVTGTGSCSVLHLNLGPLNLNLLGLAVDLNQVVLDITAQPGAGNLLGNLLCAVAGLLDNPSGQLVQLLNSILRLV